MSAGVRILSCVPGESVQLRIGIGLTVRINDYTEVRKLGSVLPKLIAGTERHDVGDVRDANEEGLGTSLLYAVEHLCVNRLPDGVRY